MNKREEIEPEAQSGSELDAETPKAEAAKETKILKVADEVVPFPVKRKLIYRGTADVVSIGELRIRPGKSFTVSDELAEELLTWPYEPFEEVKE